MIFFLILRGNLESSETVSELRVLCKYLERIKTWFTFEGVSSCIVYQNVLKISFVLIVNIVRYGINLFDNSDFIIYLVE